MSESAVSQEDATLKASEKPKRLIIPKILTSSETTDSEKKEDIDEPMVHINKKFCKSFAQKENAKKVINTYKNKVLMESRKDLNMEYSNSDSDEDVSNNNDAIKNVVVNLTNCLGSTNGETEDNMSKEKAIDSTDNPLQEKSNISFDSSNLHPIPPKSQKARKSFLPSQTILTQKSNILSNISNVLPISYNSQKARKSFPPSKTILTQVVARNSKEGTQQSIAYSPQINPASPETILFRERLARLGRASISPSLSGSTSPHRSTTFKPINLFGSTDNQINNDSMQVDQILSITASSPPRNTPTPTEELPKNQAEEVTYSNEELSSDDDDIDEENRTQCKHLYNFKYKLYKTYRKKKIDMRAVIPEDHERYEEVDENKIYLGLGCKVGQSTWRMAKAKRHTGFLRDLGGYIWKKRELSHRCLDLTKVKNRSLPGGGSVQLCSPRKLNLFLSIYEDYLNESKRYKNLTETEKDRMIQNSTETLSSLINVERDLFLKKYSIKTRKTI